MEEIRRRNNDYKKFQHMLTAPRWLKTSSLRAFERYITPVNKRQAAFCFQPVTRASSERASHLA
jgi:hypothetical protein